MKIDHVDSQNYSRSLREGLTAAAAELHSVGVGAGVRNQEAVAAEMRLAEPVSPAAAAPAALLHSTADNIGRI